jgi:hypothetical protein
MYNCSATSTDSTLVHSDITFLVFRYVFVKLKKNISNNSLFEDPNNNPECEGFVFWDMTQLEIATNFLPSRSYEAKHLHVPEKIILRCHHRQKYGHTRLFLETMWAL